jgi:hypothetical protein
VAQELIEKAVVGVESSKNRGLGAVLLANTTVLIGANEPLTLPLPSPGTPEDVFAV